LPAAIQRLVPDSPLSAVQKWRGYRTRGASSCDYGVEVGFNLSLNLSGVTVAWIVDLQGLPSPARRR
jgi:hypothetical protein